jgi:hypothetical protein
MTRCVRIAKLDRGDHDLEKVLVRSLKFQVRCVQLSCAEDKYGEQDEPRNA